MTVNISSSFPERQPNSDRLNHISIETNDAEAMRKYLASRGIKTPAAVGKGRIGNANFNITDPDGHTVRSCSICRTVGAAVSKGSS